MKISNLTLGLPAGLPISSSHRGAACRRRESKGPCAPAPRPHAHCLSSAKPAAHHAALAYRRMPVAEAVARLNGITDSTDKYRVCCGLNVMGWCWCLWWLANLVSFFFYWPSWHIDGLQTFFYGL